MKNNQHLLTKQLCLAIENNDEFGVFKLLENGADPNNENVDGKTPIEIARELISLTNKNIIKTLIAYGAEYNFIEACMSNNPDFIYQAIKKDKLFYSSNITKFELEIDDDSATQISSALECLSSIKILIEELGVNIDAQGIRYKKTVLLRAVEVCAEKSVELLLKYRPNLFLKDYNGNTVFDLPTSESIKNMLDAYKIKIQKNNLNTTITKVASSLTKHDWL